MSNIPPVGTAFIIKTEDMLRLFPPRVKKVTIWQAKSGQGPLLPVCLLLPHRIADLCDVPIGAAGCQGLQIPKEDDLYFQNAKVFHQRVRCTETIFDAQYFLCITAHSRTFDSVSWAAQLPLCKRSLPTGKCAAKQGLRSVLFPLGSILPSVGSRYIAVVQQDRRQSTP